MIFDKRTAEKKKLYTTTINQIKTDSTWHKKRYTIKLLGTNETALGLANVAIYRSEHRFTIAFELRKQTAHNSNSIDCNVCANNGRENNSHGNGRTQWPMYLFASNKFVLFFFLMIYYRIECLLFRVSVCVWAFMCADRKSGHSQIFVANLISTFYFHIF